MLIPALYQAVETLHIFIPVLAILACIIIFACGMRSSKSAQPTEEYLTEIKAKTKQKTKNLKLSTNPSKTLEKHSPSAEKQSNQKPTTPKADEKKAEAANESPKKPQAKSPKHGPTKPAAFAENLPKTGSDSPQNSAWVTVSSKRGRKEMKEAQAVKNGTVVQPIISPVSVQQNTRKNSEGTSSDQRGSVSVDDFGAVNEVVAVDPEDAEEAWLMGKDSRYRKSKRGKGQEKEAAPESPGPISDKVNAGNGNINDFIPVDTRKRRNVRRDN